MHTDIRELFNISPQSRVCSACGVICRQLSNRQICRFHFSVHISSVSLGRSQIIVSIRKQCEMPSWRRVTRLISQFSVHLSDSRVTALITNAGRTRDRHMSFSISHIVICSSPERGVYCMTECLGLPRVSQTFELNITQKSWYSTPASNRHCSDELTAS